MATSKLLKPTNETISIPGFTDRPDQRVNTNCIDKEADAINALNDQIANLITTESKTDSSVSVTANTVKRVTFDASKTGYTPIGIINTYISVFGSSKVYLQDAFINSNNAYIDFISSDTETAATVSITVLYKKNL